MPTYPTLEFSEAFLDSFLTERLSPSERKQVYKALQLLDQNERHPSLRVHQLRGELSGQWSVSASSSLRITFVRLPDGRKSLVVVSRHYGD